MEEKQQLTRILHIVTYMGCGGLEAMLMNYYRHINRRKLQFDFLVHRDFEAYYDNEIVDLGGKIYHISRLVPWSSKYKERLKEFFKEHPEYRIVHVHQDCLSSVALQCAKECGVTVRIAHSHSSSADKNIKYPIKLYYMKKIPNYATDLLACSVLAGKWMFSGYKFHVLHNAIDAKQYTYSRKKHIEIREKLGIGNEILIGHVGRFSPVKNHKFLLEVFAEIVKIEPQAKLILIGDGDNKEKICEVTATLGLREKVIFTGTRPDVNKIMQAMDIFVFPSIYEGLPVVLIEAQAAGLPCVISNRVSNECVITNGLVTYKDLNDGPKAWAEHILLQVKLPRTDHYNEILESGYDIAEAAKWLENYYLKL